MKTSTIKALLIFTGSMLIGTGTLSAGVANEFSSAVTNELSNFHIQGLYVIAGIVTAGLVIYLFVNHFGKEEKEEQRPFRRGHYHTHRRHHHQRSVVKKTA